ncbi:MAG: ribosome-associated translation inhibitor RaiA [Thermoleophilia bacterium]|nr:ribosome-associated translation inhibitor RaiA [Thermoleophilia bacterium]
MQIEIRTRNGVALTDELRDYVQRRFGKVSRQVSELARLELELNEEHNPAIAEQFLVDAVLYLKGVKLRASDRSFEMKHAIHEVSDELGRQVERHREKRRRRREIHRNTSVPA